MIGAKGVNDSVTTLVKIHSVELPNILPFNDVLMAKLFTKNVKYNQKLIIIFLGYISSYLLKLIYSDIDLRMRDLIKSPFAVVFSAELLHSSLRMGIGLSLDCPQVKELCSQILVIRGVPDSLVKSYLNKILLYQ